MAHRSPLNPPEHHERKSNLGIPSLHDLLNYLKPAMNSGEPYSMVSANSLYMREPCDFRGELFNTSSDKKRNQVLGVLCLAFATHGGRMFVDDLILGYEA